MLEVGTTGNHNTYNVRQVVSDKVLGGELGHFSDVVVSLFFTNTGKTHGGLTTTPVLFGKLYRNALEHFFGVALQGCVEHSVTVYNDKAELVVIFQKTVEGFGVEPVLALVHKLDLGDKRFHVDDELLLGFAILEQDDTDEQNEAIVWSVLVKLQL